MRIIVEESGNTLYDINTIKKKVVIGRGSRADLVIQNENISRKHVEIFSQDDDIFVRRLSTNWVFIKDQEVLDEPIVLEQNTEINLPGGYVVKAFAAEVKKVSVKRAKIEFKEGVKRKNSMDPKELIKFFGIIVLICLGIGFFIYRDINREVPVAAPSKYEKLKQKRQQAKWQKKKRELSEIDPRVIEAKSFITQTEAKSSIDKEKCGKESFELCRFILGDFNKFEGIVLGEKEIYIYIDLERRITENFSSQKYKNINKIPKDSLELIVASHYTLNPRVLTRLKKLSSSSRVYIHLVQTDGVMASEKRIYMIDLTDYFSHTMTDYKLALDEALHNLVRDYFDNLIAKHIHEIK